MKKFITLTIVLASFYFSASAQTTPTATTASVKTEKTTKAMAATMYVCPMKCEKASTKAGKCAKCGMDKVTVK
mgnify:CR=1 FL=1